MSMSTDTTKEIPKVRPHRRDPFVPVPHSAFDALPSLTGAETKVLFVVIRQTLGWAGEKDSRKERDWISQGQFKEKTGLASGAVSKSIDALVRRGLVIATDGGEGLLDAPSARRARRGRVYFSLGSGVAPYSKRELEEVRESEKNSVYFPNTTKETEDKRELGTSYLGGNEKGQISVYATDGLGRRRRIDLGKLSARQRQALLETAASPMRIHGGAEPVGSLNRDYYARTRLLERSVKG